MFPVVPGWDVAGVVERVGLDTPEFAVGDEVIGYVRKDVVGGGTTAELVAAPVRTLARKPASLSWEEAAAAPARGSDRRTSRCVGSVSPRGDTVLVHNAAGGVGSFAVQIAVAFGARVIGTASPGRHDYVRGLGAEPVPYGDAMVDAVRALAPEGVDVVLDLVGGGVAATTTEVGTAQVRLGSVADGEVAEHGGTNFWVRPDAADLAALADLGGRRCGEGARRPRVPPRGDGGGSRAERDAARPGQGRHPGLVTRGLDPVTGSPVESGGPRESTHRGPPDVSGAQRPLICAALAPVRLDTTATALSQYFA